MQKVWNTSNTIKCLKKSFKDNASVVFDEESKPKIDDKEALIQQLYAQIGELKVANDWLKKKLL